MFRKCMLMLLILSGTVRAGDGRNSIDMTFSGTIVKPSCQFALDRDATVDFGKVDVSALRYYDGQKNINALGGSAAVDDYTVSKYISSPVFHIEISGCSADQIKADDQQNQFALTITPVVGQWVTLSLPDYNGNTSSSYMNGGISPPDGSGASGFAAKFLVPSDTSTDNPNSWLIFTGNGISTRPQSGNVPAEDKESGSISEFNVSLSKLATRGSGDMLKWLIPMKVKLGMKSPDANTSGEFRISANITITYY